MKVTLILQNTEILERIALIRNEEQEAFGNYDSSLISFCIKQ